MFICRYNALHPLSHFGWRCTDVRAVARVVMAELLTAPAPIMIADDYIVVRGGQLKGKRIAALPVRTIGLLHFWIVKSHDEVASLLLTGIPACHRPLCRLTLFKALHVAVQKARDAQGTLADTDAAEEDNFDFGGEAGVDIALETPMKKKRTSPGGKMAKMVAQRATIEVVMPRFYGQDEPTLSVTMLNSKKDIGILASPKNLQWIAEYVHAERQE